MSRPALLVLCLLGLAASCDEPARHAPPDDAGPPTQTCVCPCAQFEAPTTAPCWEMSCVPLCGPGSGNAC